MITYVGICLVIIVACASIGALMILHDRIVSERRKDMVDQVANAVSNKYVPAVYSGMADSMNDICEKFVTSYIPRMIEACKKAMEKKDEIE